MYDYLIVGSGLYGAVFAYLAKQQGKKILVLEKRSHIGGNIYSELIEGINVHKYGAHIFHTSNKKVWKFVNSFVEFNRFTNSPVAVFHDRLYNLPFNMNTFYTLWGCKTPLEAMEIIDKQRKEAGIENPKNLEEQAISLVGSDIYRILIKEYTEKQWGRKCSQLPPFIIKRLPIRFTFDNNYFNDLYQGIPLGGYNCLIEKLLDGVEVKISTDFFENRSYWNSVSKGLFLPEKLMNTSITDTVDWNIALLNLRQKNYQQLIFRETRLLIIHLQMFLIRESLSTNILSRKIRHFAIR